ncbi:VanZ family protein [Halobacillus andaensis]|uniref:VanZ family protein n=1 Tax=Halobacillus andaensis TaxID=1176239 RepID=A0A917F0M2_HALAA|nr:VanZ family protein [Halobacillus andaensis]MBP2005375.1 VanZ family protein [Halobacillus andaensis]GGF31003.1 VanZ family protein [Halobacillus andaensis]
MKKFGYWIPSLLWMGMIYYSSSTPYEEQDVKPLLGSWFNLSWLSPFLDGITFTYNNQEVSVSAQGVEGFIEFFIRKGAHIGVFFILTLLLYFGLRHSFHRRKRLLSTAWLLTVSYAVFDELHQGLTPNRTPYVGDVLLDALGGSMAILVIFLCGKMGYRRKKKFNLE